MATIRLYGNKINQMPGLIKDVKKSVNSFKSELSSLRKKVLSVNSSVCNLDDVVSSIQASTQTQERKAEALDAFAKKSEEFISDTYRIDREVGDVVVQLKDDFYKKYSYLKPDSEKNGWEKFCDGCKAVGEWCKEHWKLIATAVIVVVAVVLLCTGVGGIFGAAALGALLGAGIGGVSGGLDSMANGGSFLEGFENGAFSGAISGAIMGGALAGLGALGATLGKGVSCLSKLGKLVKVTAVVTKTISAVMGGFDTLAMMDKIFGVFGGNLAGFNSSLHSSTAYNVFQIGVTALAAFTGGMTSTMTCFVAGTMILTASGLVAIENIKAGDKVISTNPETGDTAEKPVLETYVRQVTELVHLTVGGEEIITTHNHPFYIVGKGFVNAGQLRTSDVLLDKNRNKLTIDDISFESAEKPTTVYNFKVEEYHTYYAGKASLLVHNSCGKPHHLEAEVKRDGKTLEGTKASYESGGDPGCGKLNFQEQLDVHTEAKFLRDIDGKVIHGDHLEMIGELDPCQPGCQPKIRQFVADNDVTASYQAKGTGKQWNWKPNGDGTVNQTVVDTSTNTVTSDYTYYRKPSGVWGRRSN